MRCLGSILYQLPCLVEVSLLVRSEVIGYEVGIARHGLSDSIWVRACSVNGVLEAGQDFLVRKRMVNL